MPILHCLDFLCNTIFITLLTDLPQSNNIPRILWYSIFLVLDRKFHQVGASKWHTKFLEALRTLVWKTGDKVWDTFLRNREHDTN